MPAFEAGAINHSAISPRHFCLHSHFIRDALCFEPPRPSQWIKPDSASSPKPGMRLVTSFHHLDIFRTNRVGANYCRRILADVSLRLNVAIRKSAKIYRSRIPQAWRAEYRVDNFACGHNFFSTQQSRQLRVGFDKLVTLTEALCRMTQNRPRQILPAGNFF
jgi:hypothetical protein